MKGQIVGVEQRVFGEGQQASRRISFAFRHGDAVERVYRASLIRCELAGCSVTADGQTQWYSGAIVPELWPPDAPRTGVVLDAGGSADASVMRRDDGSWSFVGRAGRTTVWVDDEGRPSRARFGAIDWLREQSRPGDPEPVDVGRLLSLPVARQPRARHAMIGEYLVDGSPVRIDVPMWAELPDRGDAVRALVMEVADRIWDDFVPGLSGAGASWFGVRRGDCTEHALLLVETARARGYEARTAAGYVYVDDAESGRLALHAWAEISIAGRWIGADAALRQFPTDATHIKVGEWITDLPAVTPTIEIRSIR